MHYNVPAEATVGISGAYRIGFIDVTLRWQRVDVDNAPDATAPPFSPPAEAERMASMEELLDIPAPPEMPDGEPEDLVGEGAPAFELPDLLGDSVAVPLRDDPSPVVILDFWATWCVPCIRAMPDLIAVAENFGDDVRLLAVNVGESAETAAQFIEQRDWPLSVLLDEENDVSLLYNVSGIPQTVVLDRHGIIRHVHVGYDPDLRENLTRTIRQLVQQ